MPKTSRTLTFREVQAIKKPGFHALGGSVGLYLFINENGLRYYYYRFKSADGKRSAICLGSFDSLDLAEARRLAFDWKERVSKGENPSLVKARAALEAKQRKERKRREELKSERTFAHVSAAWLLERTRSGYWKNHKSGEGPAQSKIDRYLNPAIGDIPIHQLKAKDVFEAIKPIFQTKPSTADKTIQIASAVWRWASAMGWCEGENPAERRGSLGILLEPYKRNRKASVNMGALDFNEVPDFFVELHAMPGISAKLTEFAILTALRSEMARFLRWSDVDLENGLVRIPESSNKVTGRGVFTAFLSTQAIDLLKSLPREHDFVFPSPRFHTAMSDQAPGKIFKILNQRNIDAGGSGWLDREQTKTRGVPVLATVHGTARASFKTWARTGSNRRKFDDDAVELCLAHKLQDQYDGAYNRAQLEPERREVMQAWGDFCYSKIDR